MSLLLSGQFDRHSQNRKVTKRDVRGVSPRWRFVLELHMAGHLPTKTRFKNVKGDNGDVQQVVDKESIQELSGYSPAMIHRILSSDEVKGMKQQIMAYYDEEFTTLYPQVIEAVRKGLDSGDKYLEAAKVYLKEFGTDAKGPKGGDGINIHFTAEDMVFQILQQRSGESEGLKIDLKQIDLKHAGQETKD